MLRNVKIENFRCFESFELQQLGRVNLLVGANNSGKTSILEAIQLLCSRTNLEPLAEFMIHRGEYFCNDDRRPICELDVSNLFNGREIKLGSKFSISGVRENIKVQLDVSIAARRRPNYDFIPDAENTIRDSQSTSYITESTASQLQKMLLEITKNSYNSGGEILDDFKELEFIIEWTDGDEQKIGLRMPLTTKDGLTSNIVDKFKRNTTDSPIKTQFITSSSLSNEKMLQLFDRVVLTSDEELVLEALQTIEPNILRVASVNPQKIINVPLSRSGFVVRLRDKKQRVPIGSMGDGVWRMFGLALATVCAADGVLLVDEIDTGLHFSTIPDMWKIIWSVAKKLNVQVFATTHNSDCWQSLASIAEQEDVVGEGITIQRIERDKQKAVAFTEREIIIAADRGIEVR